MKRWQLLALGRIGIIKYVLLSASLAPIIDLIDGFTSSLPTSHSSMVAVMLIVAIGFVFLSAGREFQMGSNMRRSFELAGVGFLIMAISEVNLATVNLFWTRVLLDCIEMFLFGMSFYYAFRVQTEMAAR